MSRITHAPAPPPATTDLSCVPGRGPLLNQPPASPQYPSWKTGGRMFRKFRGLANFAGKMRKKLLEWVEAVQLQHTSRLQNTAAGPAGYVEPCPPRIPYGCGLPHMGNRSISGPPMIGHIAGRVEPVVFTFKKGEHTPGGANNNRVLFLLYRVTHEPSSPQPEATHQPRMLYITAAEAM